MTPGQASPPSHLHSSKQFHIGSSPVTLELKASEDWLCSFSTVLPREIAPAAETSREAIETTFRGFAGRDDVGLILISSPIADSIRCEAKRCGDGNDNAGRAAVRVDCALPEHVVHSAQHR